MMPRRLLMLLLVLALASPAAFAKKDEPDEKQDVQKASVQYTPEQLSKLSADTQSELRRLSAAIHEESVGISNAIKDEQETALTDLALLWEAAVAKSSTIRYAIEKLSRRDATGKPLEEESLTKKLTKGALSLGGVAGSMMTGSPTGVLGSSMLEDMLLGNPTNSAYSRVTDADLVILAKEIEDLQSKVVNRYYAYRHAKESWTLSQEALQTLGKYSDNAAKAAAPAPAKEKDKENTQRLVMETVAKSLHEGARQDEVQAKQHFMNARSELVFVVGDEAVMAMEHIHAQ